MQLFGEQAHHNADKGGGDDPAPPRDAAPGQVDQSMADEADQAAGNRAVHSGQQGHYHKDPNVYEISALSDEERISELEHEVRDLKRKNEILKKALIMLAKDN